MLELTGGLTPACMTLKMSNSADQCAAADENQ